MNIDDPMVSQFVFHPRGEGWEYHPLGIPTKTLSGSAEIGGYLHLSEKSSVLMIFFHGNGEIAADYDALAEHYTACGLSLWVVDYRGYGRSTGTPAYTHMFTDAEVVLNDLPRIEEQVGRNFSHTIVMGRSLGSASAIYLAATQSQHLQGLILDSPYADGPALIRRLGGPSLNSESFGDFKDSIDHMGACHLPTLIVHGTVDYIIPVTDSEALYHACPSNEKRFVPIEGAGHNDLLLRGYDTYFTEIRKFIGEVVE